MRRSSNNHKSIEIINFYEEYINTVYWQRTNKNGQSTDDPETFFSWMQIQLFVATKFACYVNGSQTFMFCIKYHSNLHI